MGSGFAVDASDFRNLTLDNKLTLRKAFDEEEAKESQRSDIREMKILFSQFMISQADPWKIISESHWSRQDSADGRNRSVTYYGLTGDNSCQVLGGPLPQHVKITNAHIWPRSSCEKLVFFDLRVEDVNEPQNILRLHQCIERAFDKKELTFVADGVDSNDNPMFVVKVLSPALMDIELKGTNTTFRNIVSKELIIKNQEAMPYRRLLSHHSVQAHRYARIMHWVSDDSTAEEENAAKLMEYSLDKEAQERIKSMLKPSC